MGSKKEQGGETKIAFSGSLAWPGSLSFGVAVDPNCNSTTMVYVQYGISLRSWLPVEAPMCGVLQLSFRFPFH